MLAVPEGYPSEAILASLANSSSNSVNVCELFDNIKVLLAQNECSPSQNVSQLKSTLKKLLRHKFNQEPKKFIGLVCIYVYISNSSQKIQIINQQFVRNFHKTLIQTYTDFQDNKGTPLQRPAFVSFSTMLFLMVTFIHKIQTGLISHQQFFNQKMILTFLTFVLPDDERLLKSYQTIILHLMKNLSLTSPEHKKLFFQSVLNQLACKNLPDSFGFVLLNFVRKNMKFYKKIQINQNLIFQKFKQWMHCLTDPRKLTMVLETATQIPNFQLSFDEYMICYQKLTQNQGVAEEHSQTLEDLISCIAAAERNEANWDKLLVFSFQHNICPSLTFRIIANLISRASFELLMQLLSAQGYNLLNTMKDQMLRGTNDSGCCLRIIVEVMRRFSRENEWVYQVVRKEVEWMLRQMSEEMVMRHSQRMGEIWEMVGERQYSF